MSDNKVARIAIGLAIAVIITGLGYAGYMAYANDPKRAVPLVYSENTMLNELWNDYKIKNIEPGTNRTLDKQQDNITTSEGQSYTMMRAVWVDDKDMFDKSWKWTKDNLQRDDKLMSWKFGRLPDGKYGIQETVGGLNTATDGDSDISLALLMAYMRWNDSSYLYDATPVIGAMWEKEVVTIQGKPVLVSNDLERNNMEKVIINPSYFSPYAYKVFAKVDPAHDWNALADNSYEILKSVSDSKLDSIRSGGLPPDWVMIDRRSGEIRKSDTGNLTTNYSYDAMRTSWRLAMDYSWFKDERAKQVLQKYALLNDEWQKNKRIGATYGHDGTLVDEYETAATYGGSIGYFKVVHPETAKDIYKNKLQTLYDPNQQKWKSQMSYYDDNWAWFGMALMEDALPNLTEIKQ
jgi:endoglucanase